MPTLRARWRVQYGFRSPPFGLMGRWVWLGLGLVGSAAFAQPSDRVDLGRLSTGATVSFVRGGSGEWGIEVRGTNVPRIQQPKPVRIEVFSAEDDIRPLVAGYQTVEKTAEGLDARSTIADRDGVSFRVQDRWSLDGAVVAVRRSVRVTGNAPGGFESSVVFAVDPSVNWSDVNCLAPGALYGDPTYDGERSPGGTLNHAARRFLLREDILPAPLFALSFRDGASVAVLDPAPRGDSTLEETRLTQAVMIDARFQFGALGAWQSITLLDPNEDNAARRVRLSFMADPAPSAGPGR